MKTSLLLSTVVATIPFLTSGQRTTVSLQQGWRFNLGPVTSGGTCSTPYPINLNNYQCNGLTQSTTGGVSASACQQAACDMNYPIYQYCSGNSLACGVQSCWIGSSTDCNHPQNGWISGSTNGTTPWLPPASQPTFDDSTWDIVDLPHDATIIQNYTSAGDRGEAYLPFNVSYYRKHFVVPSNWSSSFIYVYIEGALSVSNWWLNGVPLNIVPHYCGYTPQLYRIDNISALNYGPSNPNILVAFINGGDTTGWWYEGSGLYRKIELVSVPMVHIADHGITNPAYTIGSITPAGPSTSDGLVADTAYITPTVEVENAGSSSVQVTVTFSIYASFMDGGNLVTSGTISNTNVPSNSVTVISTENSPLSISNAKLWSVPRPYLYTLSVTVSSGSTTLDSMNVSLGIRDIAWNPDIGMLLNQQPVKHRGFCNHESFTGVGNSLVERIDLLRIQQMRSVGGNAWRTSHNPPEPILIELADRLGIMLMDENRVFATNVNCPNCPDVPSYSGDQVQDMIALVRRDRTHPSVIWWSFCNEAGCGDGSTEPALDFRLAAYINDGSRYVGANMGWKSPTTPSNMSDLLDVMGFSHADSGTITRFHEQEPGKPLIMSECCSCETQRGEDGDLPHDPTVSYSNENSACVREQTQTSNGVPWMAGTYVWTLHDYIGEPGGPWPAVSSSFGSFDLSGFTKAPVYWYRSWWLGNISLSDAGRPPLPANISSYFCHIVESWQPPAPGKTTRDIHVYTNAPFVNLMVNNQVVNGSPVAVAAYTAAEFPTVTFQMGTLTANCVDYDGKTILATSSKNSFGAPASIQLTLDVPSLATGTGSKVYLDGHDVALVRATIVDSNGNVVHNATNNVTFIVTAGPGLISGVGNGNPADINPNKVNWRPAYHGLVRGIVRVTMKATDTDDVRSLEQMINIDAGASGSTSSSIYQGDNSNAPTSITVMATSPGLPNSAPLTIPLSVDPMDSVYNVAAMSVMAAYMQD